MERPPSSRQPAFLKGRVKLEIGGQGAEDHDKRAAIRIGRNQRDAAVRDEEAGERSKFPRARVTYLVGSLYCRYHVEATVMRLQQVQLVNR